MTNRATSYISVYPQVLGRCPTCSVDAFNVAKAAGKSNLCTDNTCAYPMIAGDVVIRMINIHQRALWERIHRICLLMASKKLF